MFHSDSLAFGLAALGIFSFILIAIILVIIVIYFIGLWKMFQKAGKQGWEAIIPFYNSWTLVEISGLSWWWFFLVIADLLESILQLDNLATICSLVSIVASFFCNYNISKKLHQGTGFAILMTLFPFVLIPMIGFSNHYQFDHSVVVSENGPIGSSNLGNDNSSNFSNNQSNHDNGNVQFCPNCGKKLNRNSKYCGNCGKEIS